MQINKMCNFYLIFACTLVTLNYGFQTPDLTPEQLKSILRTNNVSNYEIVSTAYTRHNDNLESSIRVLQLTNFNRYIRLYLEPVYGVLAGKNTPVWKVNNDRILPLGLQYTRVPDAMDDVVQVYQDSYNDAAITTRYDKDGGVHFEGTIGNNLILRRLPSELREKLPRVKRSAPQRGDFPQSNRTVYHDDLRYVDHHLLIEIPETPSQGTREKHGSYTPINKTSRSKRKTGVPVTIYPQILVVVDHEIHAAFKSFIEFKQYVLSFWNAVDLRYRVFVNPNVRLNIAGIVISADPKATPYLHNNRYGDRNGTAIVDADKALDQAGRYFYREMTDEQAKRFVLVDNYDVIMIMTKADLCNRIVDGHQYHFDCTTLGYSYRGGACTLNVNESLVEAAGLVEDNAGYAGIVPAAHELGHLFGAPHDGRKETNKIVCSPYGGYIMSRRLTLSENAFAWSYCSAEHLIEFFHSPKAECLFNPPNVGLKIPRTLPGRILSLDEQCDRVRASYACNRDNSVCTRLECFDHTTGTCVSIASAAEGSQCGDGRYCINGKCIDRTASEIFLEIASPPPPITDR